LELRAVLDTVLIDNFTFHFYSGASMRHDSLTGAGIRANTVFLRRLAETSTEEAMTHRCSNRLAVIWFSLALTICSLHSWSLHAAQPPNPNIGRLLQQYQRQLGEAGLLQRFARQSAEGETTTVRLSDPESARLAAITESFFRDLGRNQLTVHDLMEFKDQTMRAHPSRGESPLFSGQRYWYTRVTSTWEPITDVSYSAASGALTFHRPHGNQDYRVKMSGASMEGTMVEVDSGKSYRWVAQKE
jgi:hypothetical protein